MKYLHHIITVLSLSCFFSCASDIVDMTGGIKGTVKDASNNTSIESCLVTLTPTNRSTTTNAGGTFLFEELENNTYSLTFTKDGYESQTKDLAVTAGKITNVDIQMKKASQVISVHPESLDFGDLETTKELYLSKDGGNNTQYTAKANQSWISVNPPSGTLGNTNAKITVVIDRNGLSDGEYNGTITITSSFGEMSIPVFMNKAEFSVPQVTNGEKGYDVTETSFKINGTIFKTGGSEIIEHGHCWSKNEKPTIADSKTNLGSTKEIGEFTSTISGNIVAGETYHVRAYARNAAGIAYSSSSVSVTIPKTTKPTVVTSASKNVTTNSAAISGSIADTGNEKITECGFYYGKTSNPTTKVTCSSATTDFSYNLSSLEEGTTYYYKAYAKNAKGESCGEIMSFITSEETSKRNVTTGKATNIAYSSATLNASLSGEFEGSKKISGYGFYIGNNQYQLQKKTATNLTGDSFDLTIDKLNSESKYYYYAYVLCYDGTELKGELKSFTTLQKPKITSVKYSAKKTVDNEIWLTLTVTANPAGLQITDAGFLMGWYVRDKTDLHSWEVTIVPCSVQKNTIKYDDIAKASEKGHSGIYGWESATYIRPYFVFEDGTEVYDTTVYMHDGVEYEKDFNQ